MILSVIAGPAFGQMSPQASPPPPAPAATGKAAGPVPVVMFQPTRPQPTAPQAAPISPIHTRPYSIIAQAQQDAVASNWNPGSLTPLASPAPSLPYLAPTFLPAPAQPAVSGVAPAQASEGLPAALPLEQRPAYRPPLKRIVQDTGRAIARDLPEAVADALPWVDQDRKNAPFPEVLSRVADDLNRAAQRDPEWALPVQREIRALSQQLDRLPAPPPSQSDITQFEQVLDDGNVERPFRPRPIWPGASGRPEAQVRPVSVVTLTGTQSGPEAAGVAAKDMPRFVDDDDTSISAPRPATRARGRGRPARR